VVMLVSPASTETQMAKAISASSTLMILPLG
jgi:hypothetical protein